MNNNINSQPLIHGWGTPGPCAVCLFRRLLDWDEGCCVPSLLWKRRLFASRGETHLLPEFDGIKNWKKMAETDSQCSPCAKATHSPHAGNVNALACSVKTVMSWCAKVCVDLNQSRISECAVFRASVLCIHFWLEPKWLWTWTLFQKINAFWSY